MRSSFEKISQAIGEGGSIQDGLAGLAGTFGESVDFKSVAELESFVSRGETLEL